METHTLAPYLRQLRNFKPVYRLNTGGRAAKYTGIILRIPPLKVADLEATVERREEYEAQLRTKMDRSMQFEGEVEVMLRTSAETAAELNAELEELNAKVGTTPYRMCLGFRV